MSEPVYLPNERCPVCGKRSVFVIDQVADIPVTLCLHCDVAEAMTRLPRRTRWRIRVQSWALTMEATGTWGGLALGVWSMAVMFILATATDVETWRRMAVLAVGIVCQIASYILYLRAIRR